MAKNSIDTGKSMPENSIHEKDGSTSGTNGAAPSYFSNSPAQNAFTSGQKLPPAPTQNFIPPKVPERAAPKKTEYLPLQNKNYVSPKNVSFQPNDKILDFRSPEVKAEQEKIRAAYNSPREFDTTKDDTPSSGGLTTDNNSKSSGQVQANNSQESASKIDEILTNPNPKKDDLNYQWDEYSRKITGKHFDDLDDKEKAKLQKRQKKDSSSFNEWLNGTDNNLWAATQNKETDVRLSNEKRISQADEEMIRKNNAQAAMGIDKSNRNQDASDSLKAQTSDFRGEGIKTREDFRGEGINKRMAEQQAKIASQAKERQISEYMKSHPEATREEADKRIYDLDSSKEINQQNFEYDMIKKEQDYQNSTTQERDKISKDMKQLGYDPTNANDRAKYFKKQAGITTADDAGNKIQQYVQTGATALNAINKVPSFGGGGGGR
jgi:hypothetical protein